MTFAGLSRPAFSPMCASRQTPLVADSRLRFAKSGLIEDGVDGLALRDRLGTARKSRTPWGGLGGFAPLAGHLRTMLADALVISWACAGMGSSVDISGGRSLGHRFCRLARQPPGPILRESQRQLRSAS